MSFWNDKRVVLVSSAFLAAFAYGFLLFNFGPYAQVRERLPKVSFPEERLSYKNEDLRQFIGQLTIEQDGASQVYLTAYKGFQIFDILNGALLALALGTAIWALTRGMTRASILKWLISLPLLMFVFDLSENLAIIKVVDSWPAWYPGLGALAATFTMAKMIAGGLAVTSILGLVATILISRLKKQKRYG
jgi:hypothetical protein